MIPKTILFSIGLMSVLNCNTQKEAHVKNASSLNTPQTGMNSTSAKNDALISLSEGENKFLKEYDMNITFKGVSEDSRCPEGVNCIWAGVAVAQVEVMGTATRPVILNLASTENPGRNYHQSADFNGHTITLKTIAPYPTSAEGTSALKGKYTIGISVQKSAGNATTK
ncbi:hypothetical protein [Chryseobacterium camelliae]|uniref:hypothetical protein n=1 Tax=Chryseobacterium camelliae TaxID=1265445 RepID=UPI0028570EB4|nr:hypothetical protein [Chryseobacterium camelliae]MDR6515752.1 hypothetical protein [Chryseobacterium camelliae]